MKALLLFLHSVPDLVALPLVVGVVVSAAMAAPFFGKLVLRVPANDARDDAAFDAYKAIMAMVSVVLAFSLVQVNGNLRACETLVAREGAAFATVDRTLLRFGAESAVAIRPLLNAYGRSRIQDEWPALTRGDRSQVTDDAYVALSAASRSIDPATPRQQAMFAELLRGLDELAEVRELVIQDSSTSLPPFFWAVTVGFLMLAFFLGVLTRAALGRAVGLGGAAAGVALLLAFVIIVDEPFKGETSVSPAAIQKALNLNARRI